jgi:hypothetical protein
MFIIILGRAIAQVVRLVLHMGDEGSIAVTSCETLTASSGTGMSLNPSFFSFLLLVFVLLLVSIHV